MSSNEIEVISDGRAVSPVVGATLLIGITVILASVIGTVVLGSGIGPTEAPQVTLSFEATDDGEIMLRHDGGDALVAEEIVVLNENGIVVSGLDGELNTGERATIVDDSNAVDRISVVWQDPDSDTEEILATFRP